MGPNYVEDMAVTDEGNAHFCVYAYECCDPHRFAYHVDNEEGTWSSEKPFTYRATPHGCSVALDEDDHVHLAAPRFDWDTAQGSVIHATDGSGEMRWNLVEPEDLFEAFHEIDLLVDSTGGVFVGDMLDNFGQQSHLGPQHFLLHELVCDDESSTWQSTTVAEHFVPECDPLDDACIDDEVCTFWDDFEEPAFWCGLPFGPSGLLEGCSLTEDCDTGLYCAPTGQVPGCADVDGCCTSYCDMDQVDDCWGATTCQALFVDPVPFSFEDLGVCVQ